MKELVRVFSDFKIDEARLLSAEIAANAINNILVCGSENMTEGSSNIFADEVDKTKIELKEERSESEIDDLNRNLI